MWKTIAKAPMPESLMQSLPATTGTFLPQQWVAWLLYTPQEIVQPWTPPSDIGWPMISDLGSFRAGVPETLIQWRRARGESRPDPMLSSLKS